MIIFLNLLKLLNLGLSFNFGFREMIKLEKALLDRTVQTSKAKIRKNRYLTKSQLQQKQAFLDSLNDQIETYDVAAKMAYMNKKHDVEKNKMSILKHSDLEAKVRV